MVPTSSPFGLPRPPRPLRGRPEVAVNFALTWDARISTREGSPAIFSSPRDKERMQEIRASADALIVGRGTLETDRMQMGVTLEALRARRVAEGWAPSPLRVIVSRSGQIPLDHPVFEADYAPILLFASDAMPHEHREAVEARGVALHIAAGEEPMVGWMLEVLYKEYQVRRALCEGGATLFHSFLEEGYVDEVNLTWCPLLFGGEGAASLTGVAGPFLQATREYRLEAMEVIGEECFVRYRA